MHGVSQSATDNRATATSVLDAASALSRQADLLRDEVARFLKEIRAA